MVAAMPSRSGKQSMASKWGFVVTRRAVFGASAGAVIAGELTCRTIANDDVGLFAVAFRQSPFMSVTEAAGVSRKAFAEPNNTNFAVWIIIATHNPEDFDRDLNERNSGSSSIGVGGKAGCPTPAGNRPLGAIPGRAAFHQRTITATLPVWLDRLECADTLRLRRQ